MAEEAMSLKHCTRTVSGTTLLKGVLLGVALVLSGCGTDVATAPQGGTSLLSDDEVGALPVPRTTGGIETPRNVKASYEGAGQVRVTWDVPADGYDTIIMRDDVEIGRVPSREGGFSDFPGRSPGVHRYSVCFARGGRVGREASDEVEVPKSGDSDETLPGGLD
jgi:hypothetical protein